MLNSLRHSGVAWVSWSLSFFLVLSCLLIAVLYHFFFTSSANYSLHAWFIFFAYGLLLFCYIGYLAAKERHEKNTFRKTIDDRRKVISSYRRHIEARLVNFEHFWCNHPAALSRQGVYLLEAARNLCLTIERHEEQIRLLMLTDSHPNFLRAAKLFELRVALAPGDTLLFTVGSDEVQDWEQIPVQIQQLFADLGHQLFSEPRANVSIQSSPWRSANTEELNPNFARKHLALH